MHTKANILNDLCVAASPTQKKIYIEHPKKTRQSIFALRSDYYWSKSITANHNIAQLCSHCLNISNKIVRKFQCHSATKISTFKNNTGVLLCHRCHRQISYTNRILMIYLWFKISTICRTNSLKALRPELIFERIAHANMFMNKIWSVNLNFCNFEYIPVQNKNNFYLQLLRQQSIY